MYFRRYKVNSKEAKNIPQTHDANAGCSMKYQIPRPRLLTNDANNTSPHCYINGAYNDSAQTVSITLNLTENTRKVVLVFKSANDKYTISSICFNVCKM